MSLSFLQKFRQYRRIAQQFIRIGLVRKSQFRVEFFSQIIMDLIWYATHILLFEILYLHTEEIAGWRRDEVRIFLGFLFVSDAFMMAWMGQNWHFSEELKDGKLDPFRVKPASTIFLYFFQRFSPEGFTNLCCGFGYLLFAISQKMSLASVSLWLTLLWVILLSWWTRAVLVVLFSCVEFYILNSDLSRFSAEICMSAEDRPLDIFSKRVKSFFIFVLPVGALSYIPACLLLGRASWKEGLFFTGWFFIVGLAVFRFWHFSFRRYDSAMG